jgi:hypothetical protein
MRYELGIYIPEDGILHSHSRENLKFYLLCEIACLAMMDAIVSAQTSEKIKFKKCTHLSPS